MFRIDVASAAVALPAPAAAGAPGYFSNGNPATSTASTVVDQDWLNSVQEELVAIAVSQGAALNKATRNQCLTAIQAMVATGASAAAIQAQAPNYAVAGGTANAITAVFTPAIAAHIAGAPLRVKITTANTGAVTFNPGPGAVAAKAPDGSAIANGELIPGAIHTFEYDGAQYLCVTLVRSFSAPSAVGLVVTNDATTPNSKIGVQADVAVCTDAIGRSYTVTGVNFTTAGSGAINLQTVGANGLDVGTFAGLASQWVNAFIIVKPDGTKAGLASLSPTAPVLPAGYIYALRCGAMRVNSTPALLRTKQLGSAGRYVVGAGTPTTIIPSMVTIANSQSRVAIAVAPFVPPTATQIVCIAASKAGMTNPLILAPNNDVGYANDGATNVTNPAYVATYSGGGSSIEPGGIPTIINLEGANIYHSTGASAVGNAYLGCLGWTDKVLAA